jgi:hypothetical protein
MGSADDGCLPYFYAGSYASARIRRPASISRFASVGSKVGNKKHAASGKLLAFSQE